ncbi:hypothetical protein HETIRDRAFT_448780 [Heterobasidion irregulare TC 32-1]|uniref:Uncharacterized protein n=1 Tax=Heterobasidion irregulare (strain TC 32-1) TaxID=747525 RepID=W4KKC4_HETIT|nr:uncharacterized protein HETIRDRAFT_448780 [Heterobasidion irregulare TC 32-1]ETW85780.1 hypothetical protein HETIRDRAFT_448780 [Heterobasidion irregulare TC 32-1]
MGLTEPDIFRSHLPPSRLGVPKVDPSLSVAVRFRERPPTRLPTRSFSERSKRIHHGAATAGLCQIVTLAAIARDRRSPASTDDSPPLLLSRFSVSTRARWRVMLRSVAPL